MDERQLNAFGGLVVGVSDVVTRTMTEKTGLDEVTTVALLAVHTRPGQSVGALAQLLGTTHSGGVRIVNRMHHAGLVDRRPGPDGRTAALHATGRGDELSVTALEVRRAALSDLMSNLAPVQVEALTGLIDDLAPALARTRAEAQRVCRMCEHAVCRGELCPVGGHL